MPLEGNGLSVVWTVNGLVQSILSGNSDQVTHIGSLSVPQLKNKKHNIIMVVWKDSLMTSGIPSDGVQKPPKHSLYLGVFPLLFAGKWKDATEFSPMCVSWLGSHGDVVAGGYILLSQRLPHGHTGQCEGDFNTSGDLLHKINRSKGFPVSEKRDSKIYKKSSWNETGVLTSSSPLGWQESSMKQRRDSLCFSPDVRPSQSCRNVRAAREASEEHPSLRPASERSNQSL